MNCLTKLNSLKWKCFDSWTVYICLTELFEKELFICIKMYLALNNLKRLICHKTQTTNQLSTHWVECWDHHSVQIVVYINWTMRHCHFSNWRIMNFEVVGFLSLKKTHFKLNRNTGCIKLSPVRFKWICKC